MLVLVRKRTGNERIKGIGKKKAHEDYKTFENHSPILHVMTTGEKIEKTATGFVVYFSYYM